MSNRSNNGFLLGVIVAILVVVIALVGWLYGSRIKQDLKNKLNDTNQTEQQQKTDTEQNQENSNLYITYKFQ